MYRWMTVLLVGCGLLADAPAIADQLDAPTIQSSGVTVEQAKQILVLVLKHEKIDTANPHLWIDGPWTDEETGLPFLAGHYHFGVVDNNPGGGRSVTLGQFSVTILTGDIWQTESCRRFRFPALTVIQKRIKEKTGQPLATEADAKEELGCD